MACVYGVGVLGELDYHNYFCLYLNRERAVIRQSLPVFYAINKCIGGLDSSFFTAICEDEDEAMSMFAQYEMEKLASTSNMPK